MEDHSMDGHKTFKSTEIYKSQAKNAHPTFAIAPEPRWRAQLMFILRRVIICLCAAIIIAVIALVVIKLNTPATEAPINPEDETALNAETINSFPVHTPSAAEQLMSYYDQQIAAATTDEEKAQLNSDCAGRLFTYTTGAEALGEPGLPEKILSYAQAAEKLTPTAQTARKLAYYEELFGNPDTAAYYNQLATERDPAAAQEDTNGRG